MHELIAKFETVSTFHHNNLHNERTAVTTFSNGKSSGAKISSKILLNASHNSYHGGNFDLKHLKQAAPDELNAIVESRRNSFLNDASNENKSQGSGDRYAPVYYDRESTENRKYSYHSFHSNIIDNDNDKRERERNGEREVERDEKGEKEDIKAQENNPSKTVVEDFGETYSLMRERNSLLVRLEQVIITLGHGSLYVM